MGAGSLTAAYAFEVSPRQEDGFIGGAITVGAGLQAALDSTFDRSKLGTAPAVSLLVDENSADREHPVRDVALAVAFEPGDQTTQVQLLAARLGQAMDNRSKPSLLMVTLHRTAAASTKRLIVWTFPQQEVFNLRLSGGHARLELLDAFNRESSLRKAAMLEGPNQRTGMLAARVLDLQSTATERAVADLWIVKFLQAKLQMSDAEGTKLLARSLRAAHVRVSDDVSAQEQINAAISALRTSRQQRWSIDSVAQAFLSGPAATAFLSHSRPEERGAAFGLELDQFDQLIQYRRFTLSNGIIVSAPFVDIGEANGLTIVEDGGERRLRAEGIVEEEQVRTRG